MAATTIKEACISALKMLDLKYFIDKEADALVLPFFPVETHLMLARLSPVEGEAILVIATDFCRVPVARTKTVAILLGELNAKYGFVAFSLTDGVVHMHLAIDLSFSSNPELLIARSILRFVNVAGGTYPEAIGKVRGSRKSKRSRIEQEIDRILDQLEDV